MCMSKNSTANLKCGQDKMELITETARMLIRSLSLDDVPVLPSSTVCLQKA
jgi:hypothetical protein